MWGEWMENNHGDITGIHLFMNAPRWCPSSYICWFTNHSYRYNSLINHSELLDDYERTTTCCVHDLGPLPLQAWTWRTVALAWWRRLTSWSSLLEITKDTKLLTGHYPWRIRMYGRLMLTKLGFLLMVNVDPLIYTIHGPDPSWVMRIVL